MPISSFSSGVQKVIMFLPGTYGTSLLRNHALRGVFGEMENLHFPKEVVTAIQDSMDCNLYFFGTQVEMPVMYMILIGAIVIAFSLYIFLNLLAGRRKGN